MAEIMEKPIEKNTIWQKIIFYFSIILLIGVILIYFIFSSFQKRSERELQNLKDLIEKERTPEMISLEKEVLDYQRKIKDFSKIIDQHMFVSRFFALLESKTHPKVFFPNINLNSKDLKVSLSGKTDSFFDLGQQLLILKEEPLFKDVNLSGVSLNKEGKVDFSLDFSLDPKIFKP